MYYYLLVNKLYLLKCNLIEAKFDKFARIWMQHTNVIELLSQELFLNSTGKVGAYICPFGRNN